MDWTELCVGVPVGAVETAAAIAGLVAGGGVYIEDYSDLEEQSWEIAHVDLIDEALLARDRSRAVVHLYLAPGESPAESIAFIGRRLEESGVPFEIGVGEVRELDWATAWKAFYHPVELSERLAICPSWEEYSPGPGQKVIRLDPGMAFGTGTHETTRLCLSLIERHLKEGARLLDVGCGSGVLAICAKLLGSGRTVGVDIDGVAVRVARENAALNGCDLELVRGDLATDVTGPFDLICANIVADVILRLAPDLPPLLADGGICVLSGVIDTRKDEILDAVAELGLAPCDVVEQNGWVALACRRAKG